jgi:primosomal protein N'
VTDAELIAAYLADREAPCPYCGYSLRGLKAARCPECGRGVRLRVEAIGPAPPEAATERERLREFLATNEAKCPRCRRRLRGHDGLECPACGLELSVWRLRPRGVQRPVLALLGSLLPILVIGTLLLTAVALLLWLTP